MTVTEGINIKFNLLRFVIPTERFKSFILTFLYNPIGVFIGYYDNSKAYKIWVPCTHTLLKVRDTIFDESNHIERITIHATDDNHIPNLWVTDLPITTVTSSLPIHHEWTNNDALPLHTKTSPLTELTGMDTSEETEKQEIRTVGHREGYEEVPEHAPKEFKNGPWLDPNNESHGCGK